MSTQPIPPATQIASLRASAEADAAGERAYNLLQALIMACLARIFARLEHILQLWQAGLLPPPPTRARVKMPSANEAHDRATNDRDAHARETPAGANRPGASPPAHRPASPPAHRPASTRAHLPANPGRSIPQQLQPPAGASLPATPNRAIATPGARCMPSGAILPLVTRRIARAPPVPAAEPFASAPRRSA